MSEKINPFQYIQSLIYEYSKEKEYDKIKEEFDNLFDYIDSYSGNKEFLYVNINDIFYNLLDNFKEKDYTIPSLSHITQFYLKFLKDRKSDINQALLFINLGSHFYDNKEKEFAITCLKKGKEIYEDLALKKELAKVEAILNKLNK